MVPKDPAGLTFEKIAAIREEFGAELSRFQGFISEVANEFPTFAPNANPAAIAAHLDAKYETEVHPVMSELETALRTEGTDTALTAVATSIAMPPVVAEIAMRHSQELERESAANGGGTLLEYKGWTTGSRLFVEAKREGQRHGLRRHRLRDPAMPMQLHDYPRPDRRLMQMAMAFQTSETSARTSLPRP